MQFDNDRIQELKKYGIELPDICSYECMNSVLDAMIDVCNELSMNMASSSDEIDDSLTDEYDISEWYGSSYNRDFFLLSKNDVRLSMEGLFLIICDLVKRPTLRGLIQGITKATIKNLIRNLYFLPKNELRCFYIKITYLTMNEANLCEVSFDDIIDFTETNGYNHYCPFGEHFSCSCRNVENDGLCNLKYTNDYEKNIYDYFNKFRCFEFNVEKRTIKYDKTLEVFPCKII